MNWLLELITNSFLITGFSSWLIAQIIKTVIHAIANKKLDIHLLFSDGGMPSGHSATVASLAMMSALVYGTASFQFAISSIFAIIVCHDAAGVRRETGKQAVLINELVKTFRVLTSEKLPELKLKELVGHTPVQVFAGIIVGVANACFMYNILI